MPIRATAPVEITLRTYAAQTWGADGRPTRGAGTDATITANVSTAGPRQIEQLPDGLRTREAIVVRSHTEIRPADQHTGLPSQEIVISGVPPVRDGTYEVQIVSAWQANGPIAASWEATCTRRMELPAAGAP